MAAAGILIDGVFDYTMGQTVASKPCVTEADTIYQPHRFVSREQEVLEVELISRLHQLERLKPNWDREGAPAIDPAAMAGARKLGFVAIYSLQPTPETLNMGASRNGTVDFAFFGLKGRRVELWVEDAETIHYFAEDGDGFEHEDHMAISDFDRLARWLSGEEERL